MLMIKARVVGVLRDNGNVVGYLGDGTLPLVPGP